MAASSPEEGKETPGRAARLAGLQARHPYRFVGVGILLLLLSTLLIRDLGLDSSFAALLPEHADAVRDLDIIGDRIGGTSSLFVVIEADDPEVMKRVATDLVERIEASDDPAILRIDWNVHDYEEFVEANKHLWLDLEDLEQIRDDLDARLEHERASANPFFLDLEEAEGPPELEEIAEHARASSAGRSEQFDGFDDGFYVHPDGDLLVFFIRTEIENGAVAPSEALIARVEEHIAALPSTEGVKIVLAGDVMESLAENHAITEELMIATSLTIVLVLLAIFVFFRRVEVIPILGLAVAVPVAVTFAFAELQVDYLNTSTAFLGAIVIGNGVNPNIMWLARYFEERRKGLTVESAIGATHRGIWGATLTASLAAAVAYGSLVLTDFRGFRDFGIIGFAGMVLCWLASMGLLPALVVTVERWRPMVVGGHRDRRAPYGLLFAKLVESAPKTVLAISAIAALVAVGAVSHWIVSDPLEYDINNLRSVRKESTVAAETNDRINEFVSRTATGTNIAILVPEREQVQAYEAELERRRDEGDAVYGGVTSIDDMLPEDPEAKLPVLAEIRETMLELRAHADDEQQELIDEWLPPQELAVLSVEDLPGSVAALFAERDGTLGRLVFVEQKNDFDNWNGRYLVQWAADVRAVETEDGSTPPLAGRPAIFADVLSQIWDDGPVAITISFLATVVLLMIGFRGFRQRFFTLLALLLGIAWMGATMAILGMRLNFLNFVAFPITFGNGVDYGVNVMRRFDIETRAGTLLPDAVRRSIVESGGAVILCSLTTIIGYMSLYSSANRSINSFGAAMAISEVTCVIAAVLTMPALLLVLGARGADPARRLARRAKKIEAE